ncbi:hypothetical protein VNO78_25635 [Psophocarpus tetragonolobus]|uniref:BZIP domain-containing protein n=1 Tax=Psophocarpus tetragonolobus TaxID=3891 RepID=A0AAN9S6V4_PSOTE
MANQTFTNLLTNDKQFSALHLPPKAPTSNKIKSNVIEGNEILFQAGNLLETHENPSLMFHGHEQLLGPENYPDNVQDLAQATNSKSEAHMKRKMANRVYSARYRLRKQARAQFLKSQADALEAEVSMFQTQLLYWQAVYDKLTEENAMMKAQCDTISKLIAEKEVMNWALMQEIQRLRSIC